MLTTTVLSGVVASAPQAAGEGTVPPPPANAIPLNAASVGRTQVVPSGQWFRVPPTDLRVQVGTLPGSLDAEVHAYVTSDPSRPGVLPAVTYRTLVFGMVPAEVTLEMSQPVRPDGRVEMWLLDGGPVIGGDHYALTGRVEVRVLSLRLDGRSVRLGDCRTQFPGQLDLDSLPGYAPMTGGTLTGTIDVAPFVGCDPGSAPDGKDLDGVLTSFASGAGNPIEIVQSVPCPETAPCTPPAALPLPTEP